MKFIRKTITLHSYAYLNSKYMHNPVTKAGLNMAVYSG